MKKTTFKVATWLKFAITVKTQQIFWAINSSVCGTSSWEEGRGAVVQRDFSTSLTCILRPPSDEVGARRQP